METKTTKTTKNRTYTFKSNGKTIRTADNPLNHWVRSLDDGKFYPTDRK
jgi:hypothetical protein